MKTYIFDVDGVLALPNQPIESQFMRWFENWMRKHEVYICTNNTYENIMPRLGRRIIDNCQAVFSSGGNSIWKENKEHVVSTWRPSYELISYLESLLKMSEFKTRSGPNIEYRTGLINFSLVGKTASEDEIKRYQQWDKISKEKKTFVESIKKAFPNLGICFGSDTSIDISESCHDKANIYNFLKFKTNVTSVYHSVYGNNKDTQESIKNITKHAMSINNKAVYNTFITNSPEETLNYLRK